VKKEIAGYFLRLMVKLRERGRNDMIPEPTRALIGCDKIEGEGESENKHQKKMKRVIEFYWTWSIYPGSGCASNIVAVMSYLYS
jgi:hypothetical protein